MEYNKLTAQIKGCEDEFMTKTEEANNAYDELIEKYFYSMRDKIVEVIKDASDEELYEWFNKSQKDNTISPELLALVHVCKHIRKMQSHKPDKDYKTITSYTLQDLVMVLDSLRRPV